MRPGRAARALGVSERTLWKWTNAGLIPHVRVGNGKRGAVLYPVKAIEEWLAQRAVPPTSPTGGEAV